MAGDPVDHANYHDDPREDRDDDAHVDDEDCDHAVHGAPVLDCDDDGNDDDNDNGDDGDNLRQRLATL